MKKMDVDAVLERMRQAYAVDSLSGLAARLCMDEMTFRVWRTRRTVPPKMLVKASEETGRSVSFLGGSGLTSQDTTICESAPVFFTHETKQVNLNDDEKLLLDNFRGATREGRVALVAASAALAKLKLQRKKGER